MNSGLVQATPALRCSSLAVVNKDRVTDGVERVGPLLLHGGHLLKEADVLKRETQQIAYIQEIGNFVVLELFAPRGTYSDDSQGSFFSWQCHSNDVLDAALRHSLANGRILFIFQPQELALLVQDLLGPGCFGRQSLVLFQIILSKTNRGMHDELSLISHAFKQPD